MAQSFQAIEYVRMLREAGVSNEQAEAFAVAAQRHILGPLVTKEDLNAAVARLDSEIKNAVARLDSEIKNAEARSNARTDAVKAELLLKIEQISADLRLMQAEFRAFRESVDVKFKNLLRDMIIAMAIFIASAAGLVFAALRFFTSVPSP